MLQQLAITLKVKLYVHQKNLDQLEDIRRKTSEYFLHKMCSKSVNPGSGHLGEPKITSDGLMVFVFPQFLPHCVVILFEQHLTHMHNEWKIHNEM